jgi:hypothetical protein
MAFRRNNVHVGALARFFPQKEQDEKGIRGSVRAEASHITRPFFLISFFLLRKS